jgi:hypothetical protein
MERAVYFDGWYPDQYCYHPSMPPRRLSMAEDLVAMQTTMLVWAGLGGGSISLPFLEEEAFGSVPARFRQQGYVNDSEFIAATRLRGIDLFAIVFEAQAWEFGAEVIDGEVVAQNELRGAAATTTLGLREFGQDRGPRSWKSFRSYFPEGLRNSDGDPVEDLWEEVASRDLAGAPINAHWVEVANGSQECHFADRNNPVWGEYLRQVIRIQVDAGAPGVQLDETDTPMTALRYGGCFCKDCVKEMRRYLLSLPGERLPPELDGVDLQSFDYGDYLRSNGVHPRANPLTLPLFYEYSRSQLTAMARTFRELTSWAREYAADQGVPLRVAGNFYDCAPYYDPLVDDVDVLVTEMRETRYQQPWYFRHGVGLARGRPLVAVENPYGGLIPELHERLKQGQGHDLFRLTIFEAAAMGANMALPYGSWLGTEIRDSYRVPLPLAVECGTFLAEIDHLISARSPHRTAVVCSIRSLMAATLGSDQFSDEGRWFDAVDPQDAPATRYWDVLEAMSRRTKTFDVIVFPDEELRANDITADKLSRYETLVLVDAWGLAPAQDSALRAFLSGGGRLLVLGDYGIELPGGGNAPLLRHPRCESYDDVDALARFVPGELQTDLGPAIAANLHSLDNGNLALHLVNYDYDEATGSVRERNDLTVALRLDGPLKGARLHRPRRPVADLPVTSSAGVWTLTLPSLPTYAAVELLTDK